MSLAQRLGKVYASATTWWRMVRKRGWCRPRHRVYPAEQKLGVRASQPNEFWHVDLPINYSRRILAWRLSSTFDVMNTAKILQQAAEQAVSAIKPPTVVADTENLNSEVDKLIGSMLFSRVLALREVSFSTRLPRRGGDASNTSGST